ALLLLFGLAALYATPSSDLFYELEFTPFKWLLVLPSVLVLLAAYGLFRRLALGRYAMYALLAFNLLAVPVMVRRGHWEARWIVVLGLIAAITAYVHWDSKSVRQNNTMKRRWVREGGVMAIYVVAVVLCLVGADLVHGPRMRTLTGPIAVVSD